MTPSSPTTETTPWWRMSPNPPCAPWCIDDHDPTEFSRAASLACSGPLQRVAGATVQLQLTTLDGEIPGTFDVDELELVVDVNVDDEPLQLGQAEALAQMLIAAVTIARSTR